MASKVLNYSSSTISSPSSSSFVEGFKDSELNIKPKLYKERFYVLFIFGLCTMISAVGWISFSPIFDLLQTVYGVNLLTVNYISMSFTLFFVPMNFPASVILDRYGLRTGLIIGMVATTVGLWLKCLINKSFWYVIAG